MRGSPKGVDPQSVGHAPPREEERLRMDADYVDRCGLCQQMKVTTTEYKRYKEVKNFPLKHDWSAGISQNLDKLFASLIAAETRLECGG